ncbi:prepilin-type N-terminal cleavage/methylation domain-containing protein [Cerasicoccus arenae]|uniref:prepilin-type N-terminal cleavage/methylation domain-containing protein n=1 Tax=Cerasicoccus arenae TaxID=424488 RepID=UPI00190558CE|nr:prepilin-type N-terminal cleavage/methylation domain-containing protein [Cerasicoccus arenae]MBK1859282.1 prepilin-type N-terminal cleavage/methylation domain-containing protein [Cerasicoccus arenae]
MYLRKHLGSNRVGFSLIELLASIATIAILAAILIVVVQRVRTTAQATECTSNLRQLHAATWLWITDSDNHMPDRRWWSYNKEKTSSTSKYQIAPYLDLVSSSGAGADLLHPTAMTCPAANDIQPSTQAWARTYSINAHASSTGDGEGLDPRWYPRSLLNIQHPTEMALFIDGAVSPNNGGGYWTNVQYSQVNPNSHSTPISYPHGNAVNVVFVDGHVSRYTMDEMIANYSDPLSRFWRYYAP